MKKLLSEEKIRRAHADGQLRIEIDAETIVTDQARAVANELQVELVSLAGRISHGDIQKIIAAVQQRLSGRHVSRALIEETVKKIIAER